MIKILQILTTFLILLLMSSCAGNASIAGVNFSGDTEKKNEKLQIKFDDMKL